MMARMAIEMRLEGMMPPSARLRRSIHILMEMAGIGQRELGTLIGKTHGAAGQRLRGVVAFREDELELIAARFEVDIADLWHPERIALVNRSLSSVALSPGQMELPLLEDEPDVLGLAS